MRHYIAIALLLATASCVHPQAPQPVAEPQSTSAAPELTLDEAIGNMLLVGFRGTQIDSTHHIVRDIRDYHVGSVILFDYDAPTGTRGRNISSPEQLKRLCAQLRELSPRLLIGVDQEGGYVSRLSPRYGFPAIASPQHCARAGLDTVRQAARQTAEMLRAAGLNLNFAPVADVNINPQCPVIGRLERSFSADADAVGQCCAAWIRAQQQAGIVSCMKHFPGHGSATGDTHRGVVDVSRTWQSTELVPYRQAAGQDSLLMVMTAHVINRRLDPSGLPASLSPTITAYLRDTLQFAGVIVTDDLTMGAITSQYSLPQAVRMALVAGADLLCLSNNGGTYDPDLVPRVVAIIQQLVADGDISPERLIASGERVRRLAQAL